MCAILTLKEGGIMPKNNKLSCSQTTQIKIASAMKQLMKKMSFDKISVSDITNLCGIHRQTFYYHFEDKYELLEWIIYTELIEPFVEGFTLDNMYEKFELMFSTMKNDEAFFKSAFKISYDWIAHYLNNVISNEFLELLRSIENDNGAANENAREELIKAQFISYGITGVVHNWAQHGMKETPKELSESIKNIISNVKQLAISRL